MHVRVQKEIAQEHSNTVQRSQLLSEFEQRNRYTFRNNELQPTSVRRSDDRSANLEVQEQRNFQRRSHVEVFNYTKSGVVIDARPHARARTSAISRPCNAAQRFVTEQFKLAACTIPPAGSKLGRPIKISDSRVVTELIALDNNCLDKV